MKKNILFALLTSFTLVGCNFNVDQLKFWEKQESTNNETTPEQPVTPVTPVDPVIPEDGTYVSTINLSGADLASFTSGQAGHQFDDSGNSANVEALQKYCAKQLDATNMLTQISCTKCNIAEYNNKIYFCVGTGYYVNNKFNEGSFKWTSMLPLHKVEIKTMPYSKLGGGGSTDAQSVVWIDDSSLSLATTPETAPVMQTFSKEYPDGTQSFEIKSTGSRVLIESITITWKYLYETN